MQRNRFVWVTSCRNCILYFCIFCLFFIIWKPLGFCNQKNLYILPYWIVTLVFTLLHFIFVTFLTAWKSLIHITVVLVILGCIRYDMIHFISFYFILFHFILFHFILFHFILFHFILFYFILFHFISFYFISFHFILFYFILFYFILFYSILLNHSRVIHRAPLLLKAGPTFEMRASQVMYDCISINK